MKRIFQIVKVNANKKDIVGNPCMRGQDGQSKLHRKDRLNLWKDYCEELLNKENPWACGLEMRSNIGHVQGITSEEVEHAMLKIKMGQAAERSGVPIEEIRISKLESVLTRIGNNMMYGDRILESRKRSVLIPLYKSKGDAKECSNYRSLKMLEHVMKILERVFVRRIRGAITISDIQMGFMPEKSTVDAIFAVRQLVKKYETVEKIYLYHSSIWKKLSIVCQGK